MNMNRNISNISDDLNWIYNTSNNTMSTNSKVVISDTIVTPLQVGNGDRLRIANYNPAQLENDYTIIGTSESGSNDNTRIVISAKYRTGLTGRIEYITTGTGPHIWYNTSFERMRLTSGGSLGIGVPNPTYQLQLSTNSAGKPGSTTWTVASDERIKENIVDADLNRCYDDIKSLKLRRFRYRDDFINNHHIEDKNVLGFIAQEVKGIYPKSVDIQPNELYNIDDFHSLNVDQLVNSLFGAVKKLITKVEELEKEIKLIQVDATENEIIEDTGILN